MKNTSAYVVLTRFGIIAAILATLMFIAPAATAQEASGTCKDDFKCTYPENAEGPVQSFTAEDEEGDPIEWSLEGDDEGDFEITGGVLTFKSSPDFEKPADKDKNNTYEVTLVATGGKQDVEVKVTDEDEPAEVTFVGNAQPQVGNAFQAKVEDPDGDGRTTGNAWRWSKSMDMDAADDDWTVIEGAIASSYTPKAGDINSFLRATVTYSDRKHKKQDTQSGVSTLAVRARPASNGAPEFAVSAPDTIVIEENAKGPIGDPIEATDPDNDSLYYELPASGTADADGDGDTADDVSDNAKFMISTIGQLSLEDGLDYESTADAKTEVAAADDAVDNVTHKPYTVIVKVTDPSGAVAYKSVVVKITPVDEAPKITGAEEIKVKESTDIATVQIDNTDDAAEYEAAADPEGGTAGAWSVEGDDAGKFDISTGGVLSFKGATDTDDGYFRPNFEKPGDKDKNNKYQVTVVQAVADSDKPGKLPVTVIVQNAEDRGELELSQLALHVGRPVRATIKDADGDSSRERWRWYRGASDGTSPTITADTLAEIADDLTACTAASTDLCRIATARAANYTPGSDDLGKVLVVKATYRDPVSPDSDDPSIFKITSTVLARTNVNIAPEFRNTAGNPLESETVSVKENTPAEKSIGDAIVAIDDDGEGLIYSLGGVDGDHFDVERETGQLMTKSELDFEKPADADENNAYEVELTATDPSGASDMIPVTIMVTNVDEGAEISLASAEAEEVSGTCKDDFKCTYPENAEGSVTSFTAEDEEGDPIEWSLEGDDEGDFEITGGVLTFKSSPDFEKPADKDKNNTYEVTLVATGGKQDVEVKVTDEDEPAEVTFVGNAQPQVGNAFQAKVEDPDGDGRTTGNAWRWSKSMDMDAADDDWTVIEGAIASSYTPKAGDINSFLRATVTYSDRKHKKQDTQSGVSTLAVRARPASNGAPEFAVSAPDTIVIEENAKGPIGDPIEATDPDNDSLYYELPASGTADADGDGDTADDVSDNAKFMISTIGQLSLEDGLDYESTADAKTEVAAADDAVDNVTHKPYTVIVKVTDPSGAVAYKSVVVKITPVDEAPKITGAEEIKVKESTDIATVQIDNTDDAAEYEAAADPEGGTAGAWSVEGDDAGKFDISTGGVLSFKGATDTDDGYFRPNFEKPGDKDKNNKYQVTVVQAVADSDKPGKLPVTVIVQNAEDRGELELSQLALHVGRPVRATIKDADGDSSRERWRWYRGASDGTSPTITADTLAEIADDLTACTAASTDLCRIATARAANYTPGSDDLGKVLVVKATYRDPVSPDSDDPSIFKITSTVLARTNVNIAPEFRNTAGNPLESETVSVKENTPAEKSIGDAIVAIDDDGEGLIYSLGGVDGDHFDVERETGQLMTKSELDFEKPADADENNAYEVELTATDPSGASDMIPVTIMVTNVDEGAKISLATGDDAPAPDPAGPDCSTAAGGSSALAADCQVLLNLMDELVGDGTADLNWDVETPIGDWDGLGFKYQANDVGGGVEGEDSGRVLRIFLANAGLAGVVPAGFNDLDALRKLTLHSNDLTGEIPDLSDLDNLTHLVLNDNMLLGSIPEELGDMAELDYLYLHRNDLSGSIPAELGDATQLRRIWLHGNSLAGSIPAELGNLDRLRYLVLSNNMLTGEIPAELAGAIHLKQIYLDDNMLSGMIPAELGNIMDDDGTLLRLYARNNMLTGMIPSELGMLTDLTHLRLSGNMLEGCVPADIADAVDDGLDLMACDDGS